MSIIEFPPNVYIFITNWVLFSFIIAAFKAGKIAQNPFAQPPPGMKPGAPNTMPRPGMIPGMPMAGFNPQMMTPPPGFNPMMMRPPAMMLRPPMK